MKTTSQKTYTTRREAMQAALEVLRQHLPLIPGLRAGAAETVANLDELVQAGRDYLNVEWSRSFGVGCSLSIGLRAVPSSRRASASSTTPARSWR